MKKEPNNWFDMAPDAIIGYCAVALGSVCFILALGIIAAIVRFVAGAGAV